MWNCIKKISSNDTCVNECINAIKTNDDNLLIKFWIIANKFYRHFNEAGKVLCDDIQFQP